MANDGVATTELLDLLKATQEAFPLRGSVEVLLKYQDHVGLDRLMSGDGVETLTGKTIDTRVQVKTSGAAKQTQPYAVNTPTVSPVVANLSVPWTFHVTDYSIERREVLINAGTKEQLFKLVGSRRVDAFLDSADLMEELIWKVPETTSDVLNPFGIAYWLTAITSAQAASGGGFQGVGAIAQDGNTFSDTGGLDSSTTANQLWRSYNDVWSNANAAITEDDLDKMRQAYRLLRFKSPELVKDLVDGPARKLRMYAGNVLLTGLERAGRAQNDQLGADIGKFGEMTVFKRIPLTYVPYLDTFDSTNTTYRQYPLIAINWEYVRFAVLRGNRFRESDPINSRDQHNVFTTFMDLTYQLYCINRRRAGFLISYVA